MSALNPPISLDDEKSHEVFVDSKDVNLNDVVLEKAGVMPSYQSWQNNTAANWWNDKGLRKCMLDVIILFGSIFANGYDAGLLISFQANEGWLVFFDFPNSSILGVIVSAYALPLVIFPILGAWLADKYGRKPVIFVACICGIGGPLLSGLGQNKGSFIGGRVVTGVACSFFQVTAPPLIAEISHPRFRSVVGASYLAMFYIGAVTVSWLGYGMVTWGSSKGWRIMAILQCLGCVPLCFWSITPWMAESPRYLIKKGRRDEALEILASYHANGDKSDQLVQNEMREIIIAVELDAAADKSSYLDFFKTKGNLKRFWLIVWFSWAQSMSGNNLMGAYLPKILGIAGITSFIQIQGIAGGLLVFLLFVAVFSAQLVERVGRRPLLLWSGALLVLFFTILTALSGSFANSGDKNTGLASIPFIYIALMFYVSAMVPLPYLYIPEITPYQLRSKGLAIFSVLSALGQLFNAFVNPIALTAIGWKYYIIFLVTDVVQLVIAYYIVVETKGLTLEDIAVLFDGDETMLSRETARVEGTHQLT